MKEPRDDFGGRHLEYDNRTFLEQTLLRSQPTARYLSETWKRPVRHNRQIERLALWHSVHLHKWCGRVVEQWGEQSVIPTRPLEIDPEARYQIESAIRSIPTLSPYDQDEVDRLLEPPSWKSEEEWGEDAAERVPDLVMGWHHWLWMTGASENGHDHGRASELWIAASGLTEVISGLELRPERAG